MAGIMPATSSSTIDLSRLPAPTIVEQLTFDQILAAMVADVQARLPSFNATIDSDPAVKVLQTAAYREFVLRQAFNDAARQLMVAYAVGAPLDHLAALVGVARLEVAPENPVTGAPAVHEDDDALRQRVVLAPESFSVAGPELAYVFHAKSASGDVLDASAISPAPGKVLVSVLSAIGDGTASAPLIAAVRDVVAAPAVRPLGDAVSVASAVVVPFAIRGTLNTFTGPDIRLILATARAGLDSYLARSRKLGRDITTSGIIASLMVEGVQRVVLDGPIADIICDATQAAWCTDIQLTHGGYDD